MRRISHELLDDQTPERAQPSLHDLVRINRLLGGHEVLRKALSRLFDRSEEFTALDVGAASGDMGRTIRERYPRARVTSLDYRHHHLAAADPPRIVADAFRLPFPRGSFDVVHCSLFLHHFEDDAVIRLLRSFGEISRRHIIVSDLERHFLAYHFLPATRWLFHWNDITLHDGPISVAAAFKAGELRALAEAAGLRGIEVRAHRPSFRLCLTAQPEHSVMLAS